MFTLSVRKCLASATLVYFLFTLSVQMFSLLCRCDLRLASKSVSLLLRPEMFTFKVRATRNGAEACTDASAGADASSSGSAGAAQQQQQRRRSSLGRRASAKRPTSEDKHHG